MKRSILLLAGLSISLCSVLFAQNPNVGTAGAQFLKIPVGPRGIGMGGAYVSNAGDASALFWNPAGIVHVPENELFASNTSWWGGVNLNHAAFVHSSEDVGSFGISMSLLTMGEMEVTTELQPEGTGQKFDAQDLMLGVSYARSLTKDFSVGVTMKYMNQRIWNETSGGLAFDIGTQYRIGFGDLTIGMSMTNFGPDMKYDGQDLDVKYDASNQNPNNRLAPATLATDDYPLPLHFQVGASMTILNTESIKILVAADAAHPNDNRERINVGTELTILGQVFLRGGYRFNYDQETATFGAGVVAPLGGSSLRFDYSYALYNLLSNVHRLSVGITF
ncbi:MAG: PorV/PorQ family protein [Ignavibacteriales bacterium]|nr:PorV/PorQ family protein [Ignavibacteriales bacterium]